MRFKVNQKEGNFPEPVKRAIEAILDKKGENLLVLDLREITSFTDYFLIVSGNSQRQNLAILENVERKLKEIKILPIGIEGEQGSEWILIDYGDFIVHIFTPKAREYYSLEKLWGDAKIYEF
ncbi:ribosome silencing factor [Candidatus Aminicenantes bacterium AC-708-M15]|jgi:ribosome-associated protein|nr:ribosome silencing factor [SCandidatus Aminicenantes bacterium Aminicenantia_JdfR_composite]MCP2596816.1 ribosome silencing factor [Candidatus Aminicenantes bacterium AC-335-G13]MCP2598277.1 ribosome silencing factor [Candidatus Aminicenantes bacterium AC-335-L06]MCP2604016.1 ribosome silencing factor [Candidatus Aminicenantes bacterium AC-708-M15]MCP2606497.1 ribosome silencing factor [Candidatus Aminicenantes bacterium AC-708-I09]MCP2618491.1 ribosome silencing factor [Candidatus Aminicen